MTVAKRALVKSLERLEAQAGPRPGEQVPAPYGMSCGAPMPPLEVFRTLPAAVQKRLLLNWEPPPRPEPPALSEEEFRRLPLAEQARLALEPLRPSACDYLACLPMLERLDLAREAAERPQGCGDPTPGGGQP
jgi:hypothetical protein